MTRELELNGDHVFDRLVDEFLEREFTPGSRLRESKIAEKFGVSRTPVREALKRLEAIGLLEHEPHRGMVVTEPDQDRKRQIVQMRSMLSANLCAAAAEAQGPAAAARAEVVLDDMLSQPMADRSLRLLWRAVERELETLVQNDILSEQLRNMHLLLVLSRPPCANDEGLWGQAEAKIRQVIAALRASDAAQAQLAVEAVFAWSNAVQRPNSPLRSG
jgi:DNA-binding GntR family transcriptional regulator